ncbi:hypothetical protein SLEP1_g24224 [Rubroshorea leprosula]|uniref:Uncharacterized protein n=1 Tax=Rubroshorea leprosula TaxID=152421 RepID=A0AAV5JKY3_9ROSI|nr:hypothetical protein SLEP1_g24224 [Rubroshorea leprosula]
MNRATPIGFIDRTQERLMGSLIEPSDVAWFLLSSIDEPSRCHWVH